VDLRHGEADVDEDPVARGDPLPGQQADVDRAPDAGDLDPRQRAVRHDLHDLAGYREAHQSPSQVMSARAVPAGAASAGAVPAGAVPARAVPAGAVPAGAAPSRASSAWVSSQSAW